MNDEMRSLNHGPGVVSTSARSFVRFPVSFTAYGEFTSNVTKEIVGWGGFSPAAAHNGFYGIVAPAIASNGTTWLFNEAGVLIRADCWNCTYVYA